MTDSETQHVAAALGRVASGLFVLTARDGERDTGALISWAQQCGFDPPRVTVCVRKDRDVLAWLTDGAPCTINVLGEGQKKYLAHFGKGFALDENAFAGLDVERRPGEAPILTDALAHLRCRVASRADGGDHVIIIATVVAARLHREGEPYVHVRKSGMRY